MALSPRNFISFVGFSSLFSPVSGAFKNYVPFTSLFCWTQNSVGKCLQKGFFNKIELRKKPLPAAWSHHQTWSVVRKGCRRLLDRRMAETISAAYSPAPHNGRRIQTPHTRRKWAGRSSRDPIVVSTTHHISSLSAYLYIRRNPPKKCLAISVTNLTKLSCKWAT